MTSKQWDNMEPDTQPLFGETRRKVSNQSLILGLYDC